MSDNNTLPENQSSFKIEPRLIEEIRAILSLARQKAATTVNSAMVFASWEIGKRIVEEGQGGHSRGRMARTYYKNWQKL